MSEENEDVITYSGVVYRRVDDFRGKKAAKVATLINILANNPGVPYEFEKLCKEAGEKYPQDIQAAMLALEMTWWVDKYQDTRDIGPRGKVFYVARPDRIEVNDVENPTPGSD